MIVQKSRWRRSISSLLVILLVFSCLNVFDFINPTVAEAASEVTVFKNSRTAYEIPTNIKGTVFGPNGFNIAPIDTTQTVNGITYAYQIERSGAGTVNLKWLKNNYSGTDYYDLSSFASTGSLDFDIKGNVGGETVEVALNKASALGASNQESSRCKITITVQWTHISIPLNNFKNNNAASAAACSAVGGTYTTAVQASFDQTFAQVRQIGFFDYSSSLGKIWVSDMKFAPAYVVSYSPVTATTPAGTPPTLPSVVNAVYSDGTSQLLPVTWNLSPSQYASAGPITLTGTVSSAQLQPTATVTVSSGLPHTFTSYDTLSAIATTVGVAPTLPATVKANFQDNVKEDIAVSWSPINASKYAAVSSFTASGTTNPTAAQIANGATAQPITVTVNVAASTAYTVFKDSRAGAENPSNIALASGVVPFDTSQSPDGVTPSYKVQRNSVAYWTMKFLKSNTTGNNWDLSNYVTSGALEFDLKGKNPGETIKFALNSVDNGSNAESARCELTLTDQWVHYVIPLSKFNASAIPADTTCTSVTGVGNQTTTKQANFDISKVRQVGIFSDTGSAEQLWISNMQFTPTFVSGYQALNFATLPGVAPVLPSVLSAVYSNGTPTTLNVAWGAITPSQYDTIGKSFTVQGTVKGIQIQPKATITVTNGQPHTFTNFAALAPVTANVNVAPSLPAVISASFLDLSKEDVAVNWSAVLPAQYASAPATFTVAGTTAPTPAQIASGVTAQPVSITVNVIQQTLSVFNDKRAGYEILNNLNPTLFDTTDTPNGATPSYNLQRAAAGSNWNMKFLKSNTFGDNWNLTSYAAKGALEFDFKGKTVGKTLVIALNAVDNATNAESGRCEIPITGQWEHYTIPLSKLTASDIPADNTCTTVASIGSPTTIKQTSFDISKVRQVGIFDYNNGAVEQVRVSDMKFTPTYVMNYSIANVTTTEGIAPSLPAAVTAVLSDGSTQQLNVTWSSIAESQYASAGIIFTVKGTVKGVQLQPSIKVVVTNGQPHTFAAFSTIPAVSTSEKTAPVMPATVIANFLDGSQEEINVSWSDIASKEYYEGPKGFKVIGMVNPNAVQEASGVPKATVVIDVGVDGPADIIVFKASASIVASPYAGNGFSLREVPFDTAVTYNGLGSHNVKVTGSSGYWGVQFLNDPNWVKNYPSFRPYMNYGSLEFNIKGKKGGESFKLGLYDADDQVSSDDMLIEATNEWTHVSIPLKSFVLPKSFSMERVQQIKISNNSASAMEFWLNDMHVTSDTLISTPAVSESTVAYVDPSLPTGVNALFQSQATRFMKINWNLISSDFYEVGNIAVKGSLADGGYPVKADVKVKKANMPHRFKGFRDVTLKTYARTAPVLPSIVTALFEDGVGEATAVTAWETIAPVKYADGALAFHVNGTTALGTVTATIIVRTPMSLMPINIYTLASEAPVIPNTGTIVYSDGSTSDHKITWNTFPASNYESEGSFEFSGKIEGIDLPIKATVYVMSWTSPDADHVGLSIFRGKDINSSSYAWGHFVIEDKNGVVRKEGEGATLPFDTTVTYNGLPSYLINAYRGLPSPKWAGWGATIPFLGHQGADEKDTRSYDLSNALEHGVLNFNIKGDSGGEEFNIGLSSTVDGKTTTNTITFNNYPDTFWHPVSIPLKDLISDKLDVKNISDFQMAQSSRNGTTPVKFWISDIWISDNARHELSGFEVTEVPIYVGKKLTMPTKVTGIYTDSSRVELNVTQWDQQDLDSEDEQKYVFGTVEGIEMRPQAHLYRFYNNSGIIIPAPGTLGLLISDVPVISSRPTVPIAPPVLPPLDQILTNGTQGIYKIEATSSPQLQGDLSILSVGMDTITQALAQTGIMDGWNKTVAISVPEAKEARGYGVELPTQALTSAENDKTIEIITPVGSVSLPGNMLVASMLNGAETVRITLNQVDTTALSAEAAALIGNRPVYDVSLRVGDSIVPWNNPDAPVRISLSYSPTSAELDQFENMVIVHIADDGEVVGVPSGRYERTAGKISFVTTHFSKYAVSFAQKTFEDLNGYGWAQKQIELLASKGVINGASDTTFSPEGKLTRGAFIALLARTLSLTAKADSSFSDVSESAYYAQAVGAAKKLGITTGIGGNMFAPDEEISRQDMMVITARAMQVVGRLTMEGVTLEPNSYDDQADVREYAQASIAALSSAGLVQGSNGRLYPNASITRAETAVLMHRIYTK
ncbi:Ig-like domain-containing protein [Paenibacillus radicis (ex Xue et al. 2023)]|uniref:Ig-like domain-containing protein n=1 Tax=Paenibacillus radicis (ex Xue et al. 2023) TaxID=2972489 RepID=A0ABT1YBK9_9BACL|nr:Ig-like domain-containing protein [Paenibacillus radicis (ex Xue et al. 2023)]MCR8630578.1 Ig-like domain-containing protein [Paenibacillus radicis (ex Xue et al. 2023)]